MARVWHSTALTGVGDLALSPVADLDCRVLALGGGGAELGLQGSTDELSSAL